MAITSEKRFSPGDATQARLKMLDATLSQINKQYGPRTVMVLGEAAAPQTDALSTGSILIDTAIGIGGFPRGRVVEVYGPEASGKTTVALQAIAQAQKAGGVCAFIDAEHALDPVYARNLGINVDDLVISQPDYGEQGLDIAEMLIRSGAVDLVVVDSVAALVPKAELEGDMGDTHVGLQARLMSQALRKLTPVVHKSKAVLIFINQIRQNINAMPFAAKEVTTGGNALKFYASLRIEVRRIETLKDSDGVQRGNRVRIKIAKNKMAPPFRTADVTLIYGKGISWSHDLLDAALSCGVVEQSGAWFSSAGEKLAQGREATVSLLESSPERADDIRKRVFEKLRANPSSLVPAERQED